MTRGSDFWTKRKAGVAAEAEAEARAAARARAAADPDAAADDPRSDEEVLAELGLPDPDTLDRGDDFRAFLVSAVPERIRRRALRRLWLSNPVLANLDALVDYGEDYTDAACAVDVLQTSIRLGRRWLDDDAADRDTDGEADEAPTPEAVRPAEAPATATAPPPASGPEAAEPGPAVAEAGDEPAPTPFRRRLHFEFNQDAPTT